MTTYCGRRSAVSNGSNKMAYMSDGQALLDSLPSSAAEMILIAFEVTQETT